MTGTEESKLGYYKSDMNMHSGMIYIQRRKGGGSNDSVREESARSPFKS